MDADKILLMELRACCNYFLENTNYEEDSLFFGLTSDRYPNTDLVASISATGYGLVALIIAIKHNFISYAKGQELVFRTLSTLLNLENKKGFYYHYINMDSGIREYNSEISIIDTATLLCALLCVGEFFKGKIKKLSEVILNRVDWNWYLDKKRKYFRLGYKPNRGFYGLWDNYAEQLIIYILSAGFESKSVAKKVYYSFDRIEKNYGTHKSIIHSWFGSLFTYQASHQWIDFKNTSDEYGINWYSNSLKATLAHKQYCSDNKSKFNTFKLGYWGLSSTIVKDKYKGRYGAPPCISKTKTDGTISVCALIGSIIFLPQKTKNTVLKLYKECPSTFGQYGFVTSINIKKRKLILSKVYLGIDKGSTMLSLENYFNNTIYSLLMNNEYIKRGMKRLGIKKTFD